MLALLPPQAVWIAVALVALLLVTGSLRTMGVDVENTLRLHHLRVDVRRIRLNQERRLREIEAMREAEKLEKAERSARRRGAPLRPPYVKLRNEPASDESPVTAKAA